MLLADNLNELLEIVPKFIQDPVKAHPKKEILIEIILDISFIEVFYLEIQQI